MKRLIVLTGAAAMLLATAACSSGGSSGLSLSPTASAASTSGSGGGGGSQSTSAPGGKIPSADQLASTNACSLLTTSDATTLGLPTTGTTYSGGAKSGCEWSGDEWDVIIGIRTDVGLAGVRANGGTIVPATVGSHQARKLAQGDSGCLYAIGITDSMRVDIQAGPVATGDACQEALTVAKIVEPKLP